MGNDERFARVYDFALSNRDGPKTDRPQLDDGASWFACDDCGSYVRLSGDTAKTNLCHTCGGIRRFEPERPPYAVD